MSARTRVLVVLSSAKGRGGVQRFNSLLLEALHALDAQTVSVVLEDDAGVPITSSLGSAEHAHGGDRLAFASSLLRTIVFESFDHLIVTHINYLPLVTALSALRNTGRVRIWLVAHGIEIWAPLSRMRLRSLGTVDGVLAVSTYTRSRVLAQGSRLEQAKVHVLPLCLHPGWRRLATSTAEEKHHRRPLSILSVSRLDSRERYKGIGFALESLASCTSRDWRYVVVGSGSDMPRLISLARDLEISEKVEFVGSVSDQRLGALYESSSVFLLPSANEGFGLVYLEAMHFNACVVAAAEKGALDVISDGINGHLVRYGDVVELSATIDTLVRNPAVARATAERARMDLVSGGRFSFEAFVELLGETLAVRTDRRRGV